MGEVFMHHFGFAPLGGGVPGQTPPSPMIHLSGGAGMRLQSRPLEPLPGRGGGCWKRGSKPPPKKNFRCARGHGKMVRRIPMIYLVSFNSAKHRMASHWVEPSP